MALSLRAHLTNMGTQMIASKNHTKKLPCFTVKPLASYKTKSKSTLKYIAKSIKPIGCEQVRPSREPIINGCKFSNTSILYHRY